MNIRELRNFLQETVRAILEDQSLSLPEKPTTTGLTSLYHYSKIDADSILLDPKKFGMNAHSRREKNTSDVPRVFFYTDPKDYEKELFAGNQLYTAQVPSNEIYNLKQDPLKLFQKYGRYGIHEILMYLSGWQRISGSWVKKEKENKPEEVQNINGVLYDLGRFKVVIWFDSIEVAKVNLERKKELEKNEPKI
jgi:hypothetical protein